RLGPIEEGGGACGDVIGVAGCRRPGVAASNRCEIRVTDFDGHRPTQQLLPLEPAGRIARHLVDLVADLIDVGQIFRVRDLAARRFRFAVRLDAPIVDARGELTQPVGQTADRVPQDPFVNRPDVDQPLDPVLPQPCRGYLPYSPQRVYRQLLQ